MLNREAFIGLSIDDPKIAEAVACAVGGFLFTIDAIVVDADNDIEVLTIRNSDRPQSGRLIELKPLQVLRYPRRRSGVYWIGDASISKDTDE